MSWIKHAVKCVGFEVREIDVADCVGQPRAVIDAVLKAANVLIVDDEYYTRKVIRTLLTSVGISNIHDAADGMSGLEAIRTFAPDVVLLDWEMPGMDGAEFTRRVRSPDGVVRCNVPIIMLTGHDERSRVLEAMRLGVHEFLLKPVSSSTLLARIAFVLSKPHAAERRGADSGPQARKLSGYKPPDDSYNPNPKRGADRPPASRSLV